MEYIDKELLTISANGLQIVGHVLGNEDAPRVLICCHGFGVTSDSWGMYKHICEEFKDEYLTVRFNFVSVDEFAGITYVHEYSKQVEKLKTVVDKFKERYPDKRFTIIGHSQGTFIPPLFLKIYNYDIDKLILLAPPATPDITLKMKEYFQNRPNTMIDFNSVTTIQRSDGSKTVVPVDFWKEAGLVDPISLFRYVDSNHDTYFVWAKEDPVLSIAEYTTLKSIEPKKLFELSGDHDFKNDNWRGLIKLLKQII